MCVDFNRQRCRAGSLVGWSPSVRDDNDAVVMVDAVGTELKQTEYGDAARGWSQHESFLQPLQAIQTGSLTVRMSVVGAYWLHHGGRDKRAMEIRKMEVPEDHCDIQKWVGEA